MLIITADPNKVRWGTMKGGGDGDDTCLTYYTTFPEQEELSLK